MSNNCNTTKVSGSDLHQKLLLVKRKLVSEKYIIDKKDNHVYPIEKIPFNIPSNWQWCYLSDISIIQEGPGIRKHQYQDRGVQFLTVTNILDDAIDLEKSKKYISEAEYLKTYQHFTIQKGDIVTACSGGSWGKSAIFDSNEKLILNTSTLRLRFFNDLGENRYLYYLTKTSYFKNTLSLYVTGQQPNYGYSHYSKIPIPLPPLLEQQRIVSILDEAFTAIAKAKANAEQNLRNAKELFEFFLHRYFTNKEAGWDEKKLKDVAEYFNGLTYSPTDVSDEGIVVLRSSNVQNDKLDFTDIVRVTAFVKEKIIVRDGDILMCSRNGSQRLVGKTALIENLSEQMTFGTFMMIIRSDYNPYLLWFFKSLDFKKQISGGENTMINQITRYMLDDIVVSFPPIEKQFEIVQQLDAIYNETKKLETIYQQKIIDLEELKKSILQKAFSGELRCGELVEPKTEKALV